MMTPLILRTPDFSYQFLFPLEVQEIGILLYMYARTLNWMQSPLQGYMYSQHGTHLWQLNGYFAGKIWSQDEAIHSIYIYMYLKAS